MTNILAVLCLLLLAGLKLTGIAALSWWLVFSPLIALCTLRLLPEIIEALRSNTCGRYG